MLNVQKFLQENSIDKLINDYHIDIKHYVNDNCYILSYSMIDSPKLDIIVRECRGLILSDDFKTVMCKPFTRFFNMGECEETQNFMFDRIQVLEKVDGSMVNIWYHPVKGWCAATRKMAFAEGLTNNFNKTFHNLISTVVNWDKLNSVLDNYKSYTFTFEFVSPETQVVKNYGNVRALYFLAMHNNATGEYIENNRDFFRSIPDIESCFTELRYPEIYNLHTLSEIQDYIKTMDMTDEGFVVYNPVSKVRMKIKNPKYLEIAYMRMNNGLSEKALIDMVISNETDEYLSYYPNDKEIVMKYKNAYEQIKHDIMMEYDSVRDMKVDNADERKLFALTVRKFKYQSFMFAMKDGKDMQEIINHLTDTAKKKLFAKCV